MARFSNAECYLDFVWEFNSMLSQGNFMAKNSREKFEMWEKTEWLLLYHSIMRISTVMNTINMLFDINKMCSEEIYKK